MLNKVQVLAALVMGMVASVAAAGPIGGGGAGSVSICVDNESCLQLTLPIGENGDFNLRLGDDLPAGVTSLQAFGNTDPIQTLAIGVTDPDAPSAFFASLTVPLAVPADYLGTAKFELTLFGSCTDGGTDGCSITPNLFGSAISSYTVNSFSSEVGTRGEATAVGTPGGNFPSADPWGTITGTFDCGAIGGCTTWDTRISFIGSGGGDSFGLTARFNLNPNLVPEPATIGLLVLGLFGIGVAGRRRSR